MMQVPISPLVKAHRFGPPFGMINLFHRGEEGVHIRQQDYPRPAVGGLPFHR